MVADAPRRQPGKLMDPDAVTYAQVPSRIIYLPGSAGVFGRVSGRQEVAYNLVPVDRIPEIQAQGTPSMEMREGRPSTQPSAQTPAAGSFPAAFKNSDGVTTSGMARRLGVLGKTGVEKTRAESLLARGERLEWTPDVGWVGFTDQKVPKPLPPVKEGVEIPAIPETPPTEPPVIKTPDTPKAEEKKIIPIPEIPEKNGDTEEENTDNKEGTPIKEGKPEGDGSTLQKTIGMELSYDEQ
jgi:hypothetical protein